MVKKAILAAALTCATAITATAQENTVRRLPEVDATHTGIQADYATRDTGFWIAAEATGGYSCRLMHSNFSFAEVTATAGWRFNSYLRLGVGFGGRCYFDNKKVRYTASEWAFPIFANVRGNIIPTEYRSVVPYYSVDLGGSIRDGFLFRPAVGLRIGQNRGAFLVALAYTGQDLRSYRLETLDGGTVCEKKRKFASFISLRLGYEF